MTFLNPIWLWTLLALPLMAALYLLKVRPQNKPTNALFLWQQIYEQRSSSAFFRRLRDLWSLLLMLLALLLISLGLAGPVLEDADATDLVLIVDTSASMQASAGGKSRMELASGGACAGPCAWRDAAGCCAVVGSRAALSRSDDSVPPASCWQRSTRSKRRTIQSQSALETIAAGSAAMGEEALRTLWITDDPLSAGELPDAVEAVFVVQSSVVMWAS